MFSYITLALASAASVSALAIPRGAPAGYGSQLEPYDTYHARYLAIGCTGKQGTDFFEQCCHPLLSNEILETARLPQCLPSASSAVSSAPAASATADPEEGTCIEGEEGCECDDEEEPASSSSAAPAPTSTPKATPTPTPSSSKAAATPAPTNQASSGSQVFSGGIATFFYQNGVAGACGDVHPDSDYIIALPAKSYGSFNKKSDNCGRKVQLTRDSTGKSIIATVADACPTCEGDNSIDLSSGAFGALASYDEGIFPVSWKFV